MSDSGSSQAPVPSGPVASEGRVRRRPSWKLYLLIAVCVTPVVASYLAYYVFPPSGQTNHGMLIEPQRPLPAIAATVVHAPAAEVAKQRSASDSTAGQGLAAFRGRWILLAVDQGACGLPCAEKLFFMRQTHASLGKERDRLVRVLLVTDDKPLPVAILTAHPDLTVLRVDPRDLVEIFPIEAQTTLADHLYLVDPLHNLMMRFPKDPDPARTRKDLQRLMKASRIG